MVAKWANGGRPEETAFDLNYDRKIDDDDKINGASASGVEIVGIPTAPVILSDIRYTATTQTSGTLLFP